MLRERAGDLAALVAMNGYYADFMAEYLAVPREQIHVIPAGLDLRQYPAVAGERSGQDPVTIGYLARICTEKGLHVLVEAAALLAEDADVPPFRVHAAG